MGKEAIFKQLKPIAGAIMLSMLLTFGLAIPAMAQGYGAPEGQQQEPWEQQQAAPADFSDEEIDRVASAYVDIIDIREDYHGKLASVDDPEEAQAIQMEANEKITEAVENNGVSVETYNEVIAAAQTDESLMNDLLSKIDQLQ